MNELRSGDASCRSEDQPRRLRIAWWIAFVAAPIVGVIVMIVITFVIFRFPLPFIR